ncbi:MAG: RluA family pseudouridine synthase [Bacteriovoracaceae bacterium]|nr:RluA family pseudouridine synthase [Bacteriovoracaceae bacterium]
MSLDEKNSTTTITITDQDHQQFKRLDLLLTAKLPELGRSFIKALFQKGLISYDETSEVKPKKLELKKVPPVGSIINIQVPPPIPCKAKPENIPLDILYEDEHLLFINKTAGIVTHPAPGNYTGTLVNAVLFHCTGLTDIGDELRPGIVHRLDKGTSGVMVVAKTKKCHEELVLLFSSHNIDRIYEAIVIGGDKIAQSGNLDSPIGRHPVNRLKMAVNTRNAKAAITHYRVLTFFKKFTHIECKLETGRTHQIRVHLSSLLKTPILCDPLYANPAQQLKRLDPQICSVIKDYPYPLLHAKVLGLKHPITKQVLHFEVPPPATFQQVLDIGRGSLLL